MNQEEKIENIKAGNQISKDSQVEQFVNSDDWKIIKQRLFSKLLELDSLSVLYESTKRKTVKNMGELAYINGKVCSIIIDWISQIEGTKVQGTKDIFSEMRRDDFMKREE
jgi:hypothetical protein